jgi:hypothetical protein
VPRIKIRPTLPPDDAPIGEWIPHKEVVRRYRLSNAKLYRAAMMGLVRAEIRFARPPLYSSRDLEELLEGA